jgi:hypothetical protein
MQLPKKVNGKNGLTKGMDQKGKGPTRKAEKAFLQDQS